MSSRVNCYLSLDTVMLLLLVGFKLGRIYTRLLPALL